MSPLQSVQHNTTLAVEDEGWVDHVDSAQKTADPLFSRSRSPPSVPCSMAFVHPIAQIAPSHSRWYGLFRLASLRRNSGRPQYIRVACTSLWKIIFCGPPDVLQDNSRIILSAKKTMQIATSRSKTRISPQSNARHVPKNGQARRRPLKPPGSNTRFCLDFVCTTLRQEGAGSWVRNCCCCTRV